MPTVALPIIYAGVYFRSVVLGELQVSARLKIGEVLSAFSETEAPAPTFEVVSFSSEPLASTVTPEPFKPSLI